MIDPDGIFMVQKGVYSKIHPTSSLLMLLVSSYSGLYYRHNLVISHITYTSLLYISLLTLIVHVDNWVYSVYDMLKICLCMPVLVNIISFIEIDMHTYM